MTDLNKKLLDLINQERTINEISNTLHLSHKQIYSRLKNLKTHGFEFNRKYFYDGNMKYEQIYNPKNNDDSVSLITSNTDQDITIMLISDIHLGNKYERLDLLYKIYDYCIKKNIHIIINAGDLIDGLTIGNDKRIHTYEDQINYLIKKYPFDKNIINFVCLGNHDIDSLQNSGQDINTSLNNFRHDLVSLGYGFGSINIKNEQIFVRHLIQGLKVEKAPSGSLVLHGHSHKSTITINQNCLVHIPTLSDLSMEENVSSPGAMVMTLSFDRGYYKTIYIEQLIVDSHIYTVHQFKSDLLPNRKLSKNGKVYYELHSDGTYIDPVEEAKVKTKK